MSKKKKIIISVTAIVLALATVLLCVVSIIGRQNDIKRVQEEYEQEQNVAQNQETDNPSDTTAPDTYVPPVNTPDDTGDEITKNDIILDVTDKNRDPNPRVKSATIEYGTKDGSENVE